jgi:aminopeptidase N
MWLKFLLGVLLLYFVSADFDPFTPNSESEYEDIAPAGPQDPEGLSFRLANNTRPVHYDIWLSTAIHEADFRFNGTVHIRFRTLMASNNITLNFKQLMITNVDLFDTNRILMQNNLLTTVDHVTELMVIYPSMQLAGNQEFIVSIDYNGIMRTDNYGYYRGYYRDENNIQRWYGTTQFQATDARHAFPW